MSRDMMSPEPPEPVVLIADDHDDTRDMYSGYLSENGFRVAEAATGVEAVELTKRLRPAVVVIDVQMPGMDGIAAIKRIRREKDLQQLPILVLTSYDMREQEAIAAGATAVCVKPCAPDVLLEQIRKLVQRRNR